jgi:hypothetical protein
VNQAEAALLSLGLARSDRQLYQRGDLIIRPVLSRLKAADDREISSWRLIEVSEIAMAFWPNEAKKSNEIEGTTPPQATVKVGTLDILERHLAARGP